MLTLPRDGEASRQDDAGAAEAFTLSADYEGADRDREDASTRWGPASSRSWRPADRGQRAQSSSGTGIGGARRECLRRTRSPCRTIAANHNAEFRMRNAEPILNADVAGRGEAS